MTFLTQTDIDAKKKVEAEKAALAAMTPTQRLRTVYGKEKVDRGRIVEPPGIEDFEEWKEERERHRAKMVELKEVASLQERLKESHFNDSNKRRIIETFNKTK